MASVILQMAMCSILVVKTNAKFAPMKDIIKNKFDPNYNLFWDTAEIAHLSDVTLNLFSCFVEKKGECEYFKQDFDKKCVGCEVIGSIASLKSPGVKVVITGNGVIEIDSSTIPNPVTETTTLHIVNAPKLERIQPELFEKFPNLKEIVVVSTGITSALNVSTPLLKLTQMAIFNNKVNRISGLSFVHMPNLERLNLACNDISFIADNAFEGLEKLVRLTLGENSLGHIPRAVFSIRKTIQYIGLERNKIKLLPTLPFKDMSELVHLNLTDNKINQIEPEWMSECESLRFLELGKNNLTELEPFSISGGKKLAYVTVSENPFLHTIQGNAFKDLAVLKALDIFGNSKLENIDYRAFDNIATVKYIDMSSNRLRSFPHASFIYANFAKVEKLWMKNNVITSLSELTENALNDVTSILEFRFEDVYPLSVSFSQMVKLDSLDFSSNLLTVIPNGVLDCLKTTSSFLELSKNRLHTIEDEAFVDMKLQTLYLNDNFLLEVPKALFKVKSLNILRMNKNLLTYLKRGTLLNLDMTNKLYLENNKILAIEDDALPRSLTLIDLSNNEFDFVDENQFNNMPDLYNIDFRNNRISYIPLNAFKNSPKLKNIYLSDNNINWIDNGAFSTVCDQIDILNMERNSLAFVEYGTFASKSIKEVRMKDNDLHDWPQDGSFSSQTEEFYAEFVKNKFEVIRTGMFKDHSKFQKADFEENHISDVEEYAFKNLNLSYTAKSNDVFGVMLITNPVSNLEPYSFTDITSETKGKGLTNHAGLHLENITTLYTLRSNTFNKVKLDYIFLNDGKIELIETHSFNEIYLHWTLQFNNGPLKYVAKRAVNAEYIQYIQFNKNKIRKLPLGAFEEIASCENFNIDNNEIDFIDTDSLPNCQGKFNFRNNLITHVVTDAFRKATSIKNLQLDDNFIVKIEAGAMDTFASKLKELWLNKNRLPQIPDNLVNTASLDVLNVASNKAFHTVGIQKLAGSDKGTVVADDSQGAFIDATLYENVKKNAKDVFVYGVSECTCNLMQVITNIDAIQGTTIKFKGPTKCTYTHVDNGNEQQLTLSDTSPNSVKKKLQCEVYSTNLVRVSRTFEDQLPIEETLTMHWKFPETAVWNKAETVYCCEDRASSGCINQATVIMECKQQGDDSNTGNIFLTTSRFTVDLAKTDSCDKEFSHSEEIDFSTADFIFCAVKIEIPGKAGKYSSVGAWRVGYQEELKKTEKIPRPKQTIEFEATYFDLTNDFEDFQNMGYDKIYQNPTMFDSPSIGPYLYMTDKFSAADTVTQWFTPNQNIKDILQEEFHLQSCPGFGANSHCMFARQWWPVDELVNPPTDTTANFKRHNMYFTSRLRLAVLLGGDEVLSIGGPDDVWVFMNGTLVLEVLAEEEDKAALPCGEISFNRDANKFVAKYGFIDKVMDETQVGRCTLDVEETVVEAGVFTLSDEMYVDIFTTQRRSLSSQLFLRLSQFQVIESSNYAAFSMSERKIRSGKIDTLDFTTVLGLQTYQFDIVSAGADNDNFEVHESAYVWKEDPDPQPANQDPGSGVPEFYNCSEPVVTVPVVTPEHSSTIETPTALVILKNAIDYESIEEKFKYLYLEVHYEFEAENTRDFVTPIRIRINVEDANDNCPDFKDEAKTLIDRTELCLDLRGTLLNVTDADNGPNKAIQYYIGMCLLLIIC